MSRSGGSAGSEFEGQVRKALKRIGFRDIGGEPDLRIGGHQIDCCGGWDDVLVVIECTQSGAENASIHNLISEVRGKQAEIRRGFRQIEKYQTYRRFEFAIATQGIRYTEGDHVLASRRPPVHLIDVRTIEYYQRLASLIGKRGALFNLLGELHVEPQEFDLPRVPALRVRFGRNIAGYLFWCEPHELLKTAYVARREAGRDKYYQRVLSPKRLSVIRRFIQHGGMFPNNIIVAFDRRPQFRPKRGYDESWPSWMDFGELVFPRSYRSSWVVDGQHRLYAFGGLDAARSAQKVAVFAFDPLPEAKQAKFFIEINKEQKPISPDLIWDLEGEMSPDTPEGRIANCVKGLNARAPLKDRIYLPLSGQRKSGQLKMSGFCQDLQATGLLNDRTRFMAQDKRNPIVHRVTHSRIPDKVGTAVAAFLTRIQACCTQSVWDKVLLRPGGVTVALNVYEQILIRVGQVPSDGQLASYARVFADVLTGLAPSEGEMRRLVREHLSSYAQRREITKEILRQMQEQLQDPEFGKVRVEVSEPFGERLAGFERRLAEFVADRIGIVTESDLRRRAPEGVWRIVAARVEQQRRSDPSFAVHQALTLGETREIISRRDNAEVIMPLLTDSVRGFGDDEAVRAALAGIIRARNAIDHGHRMTNRRLVNVYLETFERLIAG